MYVNGMGRSGDLYMIHNISTALTYALPSFHHGNPNDSSPCVSAAFPASFYGSVHNACQAGSYEAAVKAELLAGGDNCSRVVFSGAYAAARLGVGVVSEEAVYGVKLSA